MYQTEIDLAHPATAAHTHNKERLLEYTSLNIPEYTWTYSQNRYTCNKNRFSPDIQYKLAPIDL